MRWGGPCGHCVTSGPAWPDARVTRNTTMVYSLLCDGSPPRGGSGPSSPPTIGARQARPRRLETPARPSGALDRSRTRARQPAMSPRCLVARRPRMPRQTAARSDPDPAGTQEVTHQDLVRSRQVPRLASHPSPLGRPLVGRRLHPDRPWFRHARPHPALRGRVRHLPGRQSLRHPPGPGLDRGGQRHARLKPPHRHKPHPSPNRS